MAGNGKIIDPQQIYVAFDGYVINKVDFGDAGVGITTGGDNSEAMRGKAGGHCTILKYDKIDQVTFTVYQHAPISYILETYHNTHKQIGSLIIKDLNPTQQRTWTTTAANVKSYDEVDLFEGSGYAFTIECEENFEIV